MHVYNKKGLAVFQAHKQTKKEQAIIRKDILSQNPNLKNNLVLLGNLVGWMYKHNQRKVG